MIMFDFNRRQYQIFEVIQSGEKTSYVKAQGRFGKAFALPQGLSFYDPKADTTLKAGEEYRKQVLFYPDGHCSELFIELIDNTGSGYGITLKGFGSMARIKEVTRER